MDRNTQIHWKKMQLLPKYKEKKSKSSQGPVLQSLLSRERATGAVPELTAAFMVFPVNYYYFTFTSISQAIFMLKIWGKIHIQLLYIYFICY